MVLNSNKAEFPMIKVLIIMLTTVIILISYIFILIGNKVSIDDKKLQTQIIIDKLINDNCFSNQFSKIEKKKFNQENLDNCLKNINKERSLVRVKLEGEKTIFLNKDEEKFSDKANLCNLITNILCTEMYYPIIYVDENNKYSTRNLIIQIIESD